MAAAPQWPRHPRFAPFCTGGFCERSKKLPSAPRHRLRCSARPCDDEFGRFSRAPAVARPRASWRRRRGKSKKTKINHPRSLEAVKSSPAFFQPIRKPPKSCAVTPVLSNLNNRQSARASAHLSARSAATTLITMLWPCRTSSRGASCVYHSRVPVTSNNR